MTQASTDHGLAPTQETMAADQPDGAGAPPAAPPAPPPATDTAAAYRPEGLPPHLFGQSDRETIDKLSGAYKGARDEIAKGKPVVPKADEYQFNWSDKVKGTIAPDDPALKEFRSIAHEHGFSQQQMDAIPKLFDRLAEKGMIEKPFDSAGLLTELAPEGFRGTPEERQAKGGERLTAAEAWIRQLPGYDDAMKNELRLLTTSVAGIKVVENIMRAGMNPSVAAGGAQPGALSKSDLDTRVADPRNDAYGAKFDPAFAEETRKLFRQMYPG